MPLNEDSAADVLRIVGAALRDLDRVQTELNARIEATKAAEAARIGELNTIIDDACGLLFMWATDNREELLDDGSKTITLPTGELSWRTDPKSVALRNVEKVLEKLREKKLDQFIREKFEVDKQAILKSPDAVKGISGIKIVEGVETFYVKPAGLEVERAVTSLSTKAK